MKTALTIGGSDSCGGAGIEADLKTFSVLGVYGMTALTAVTVQNTLEIKEILELSPDLVRQQIDVVAGDIQVDACKTGMLVNAAIVEAVADCIGRNKLMPYVCDPVFKSKGGKKLLDPDGFQLLKKKLIPMATVVTPNLSETAALLDLGESVPWSIPTAKEAARKLIGIGAKAAVIKGLDSADQTVDLFFDGKEFLEFAGKTMPKEKSHGSGSAFSAAIAAGLANRMSLTAAIDQAKQLVTMAIQYSDGQGRGTSPVNVLSFAGKKK